MKKVSLLAASVALALVGCGGSDDGSDTNTGTPSAGGIVITGFDGYFKNAVVFDDMPVATRASTVGKLDSNDIIFGLTDGNGKITLPENTEIKGTLSLQTITPNGDVQKMLIARDPNKFAGIYTIDMDHPTQAMAHEVSFRTLQGEKIISPLTDLVAAKAGVNPTPVEIEKAKEEVNIALGLNAENTDVFSDVIAAGDHALHKTAQILTESKVEAGDKYTPETAITIAKKATEIVKAPENADKLAQPNFKPTIPVDNTGTVGEAIINNKLVVNKTIYDNLIKQVNSTDKFTDVTEISLIDLPIAELFVDADHKNEITPELKITTKDGVDVTADFDITKTATELTISAKDSLTTVRNTYIVTLSATDIAANNENMGIVSTTFEIKVELENAAPTLNPQVKSTLQEWLGSLELQQNVVITDEKMLISNLFEDEDTLVYNVYSSVAGLTFTIAQSDNGDATLEILGKPSHAYPAGETITISATDDINTVYQEFTLAAITEAGITINEIKYAALQEKITDITLKQNTPVAKVQLDITELFNTESVNGLGAIEYYAGLEDKAPGPDDENLHEGFTSVDGVHANVDTNGILTISGEPSTVIKDGYFYLMAGINGDAPDAITSEMVKITLADVKPADEVTPPPAGTHPLEGKFLHFVEIGNNGTEFAKAWCDSIYLDADSKTMYWNSRDNGNLSTCDTNMSEFTEGVPYAIVGDKIVSQEDGMKMTLDVIKQHSFDDDKHFLVSFTDEEGNEKSTELYSYHTNAQYVEEALNNDVSESQANPNWVDRETFIAMPSAEGSNDIVVTELKVSGIVQQFDYQGSPYSSASIYGRNAETCAILKDIYLDYGSIKVHGDNYGANNYFNSQPQYRDSEDSCYIDLMPFEHSVAIPSGRYTIEAKPEHADEAERIVFSFKK